TINVLGASCYNKDTNTTNETLCESQTIYIQKTLSGNVDIFDGAIVLRADGEIVAKGLTINTDQQASQSAGKTVIKAGDIDTEITTEALKENSLILVTPDKALGVGKEITGERSFKIKLEKTQTKDVTLDWLIINQE
ncbi:hypothetical protein HYV31_04275, partial [candidate division WWE3 bacterium]|nr:hypothetical protein [candidate division WWE3 bacterium]